MSTCTYDTGSMYGNAPACSKPATHVVTYRNGTMAALSAPVCAEHLGPMQARMYPGVESIGPVPPDWPELRTRCARCGMEDHTIEDCHAWCSHAPDQPCPEENP